LHRHSLQFFWISSSISEPILKSVLIRLFIFILHLGDLLFHSPNPKILACLLANITPSLDRFIQLGSHLYQHISDLDCKVGSEIFHFDLDKESIISNQRDADLIFI
jgi:hypothetical protein